MPTRPGPLKSNFLAVAVARIAAAPWTVGLLLLCSFLSTPKASGNPIFIYPDGYEWLGLPGGAAFEALSIARQARQEMTAEEVAVVVDRRQSTITGRYGFDRSYVRREPMSVFIPVFSTPAGERTSPSVSIGVRKLRADTVPSGLSAELSKALNIVRPRGSVVHWYKVLIPGRAAASNFRLDVSYTQPNFASNTACYLPLWPPHNNAKVTFEAAEGLGLVRTGFFSGFSAPARRMVFIPSHGRLLSVRWRETR